MRLGTKRGGAENGLEKRNGCHRRKERVWCRVHSKFTCTGLFLRHTPLAKRNAEVQCIFAHPPLHLSSLEYSGANRLTLTYRSAARPGSRCSTNSFILSD